MPETVYETGSVKYEAELFRERDWDVGVWDSRGGVGGGMGV